MVFFGLPHILLPYMAETKFDEIQERLSREAINMMCDFQSVFYPQELQFHFYPNDDPSSGDGWAFTDDVSWPKNGIDFGKGPNQSPKYKIENKNNYIELNYEIQ